MNAMAKRWIKTAPARLIRAFENHEIRNGRQILERLLSDSRMQTTWPTLVRYMQKQGCDGDSNQWLKIWGAIASAKHQSNKAKKTRKWRTDIRDKYAKLAHESAALGKKIGGVNNPMDVLIYQLFPEDIWGALGLANLNGLDPLKRDEIAHTLLPCWPSASEILHGLTNLASQLARDAMETPRPDERKSGDVNARVFVWHVGNDFRALFGNALYGTLAAITNVTFNYSDNGLSRKNVEQILSRGV